MRPDGARTRPVSPPPMQGPWRRSRLDFPSFGFSHESPEDPDSESGGNGEDLRCSHWQRLDRRLGITGESGVWNRWLGRGGSEITSAAQPLQLAFDRCAAGKDQDKHPQFVQLPARFASQVPWYPWKKLSARYGGGGPCGRSGVARRKGSSLPWNETVGRTSRTHLRSEAGKKPAMRQTPSPLIGDHETCPSWFDRF